MKYCHIQRWQSCGQTQGSPLKNTARQRELPCILCGKQTKVIVYFSEGLCALMESFLLCVYSSVEK